MSSQEHAAQHLPGDLVDPARLAVRKQPEAAERLADERRGRAVQAQQSGNVFVREHYVAGPVRDDDADLGLAQHEFCRQALAPARHRHAPVTEQVSWLLPGHEHVRGDLGRKVGGRRRVRAVLAAYPDSALNRPEQHLASGLYPGPLQFKHQVQITLKLLGYPRNCDPYRLV